MGQVNIKVGWNQYDDALARSTYAFALVLVNVNPIRYGKRLGWAVRKSKYSSDPATNEESFARVMTQMLAGDALCYKAMRIVCKTNPAYESYKPMVKEVRKKYGW